MKRIVLFIIALFLVNSGVAKNISIRVVNQPAAVVIRNIAEQTGMNFVYSTELLNDLRVSVDVKNRSIKHILKIMFRDSEVEWKINGKNIVLKRKAESRSEHNGNASLSPIKYRSVFSAPKMLEEVEVVSRLESPVVETSEIGAKKLTVTDIINTPTLFGESDVIKAIQKQPGVSEGIEGLAGMIVHGGNSDENLYMLDNIPLYQVNHLAGIYSAFNPEAIRYIDFFKSSIPSKYDGRLSSYLDVRTKSGSSEGHHGSFRLGLSLCSFNIDGPIREKTTYSVASRRSWLDIVSIPSMLLLNSSSIVDEKMRLRYAIMDLNAKVTHRFTDKAIGFLSLYSGGDILETGLKDKHVQNYGWFDDESNDLDWGNFVAQAGFNYRVNPKFKMEFTAAYTRYYSGMRHTLHTEVVSPDTTIVSNSVTVTNNYINDFILKADFDWKPDNRNRIRYGGNYILHSFLPARTERKYSVGSTKIESRDSTWAYLANEANIYIEDDWHINDRLRMNAGIHLSLFNIEGKTNFGFGPRISVSYHPDDNWAVKVAYARTNQYVHQLSQTDLALPTDQWVPITGSFKSQNADKISVGAYWQSDNMIYVGSVEGYYKSMRNLIDYKDEYYLQPPTEMWNTSLCSGKGSAKGIDFMIEKISGKFTGHISYSLAWSDRTFPDKNEGKTFPARFDNRHSIKVLINWNINTKVTFNAAWTGHSGNRFTLLSQVWESPDFSNSNAGDVSPLKANINNYQLPFYHRLDLSCNVSNRRGFWTFGLFNAYSHMNTIAIRRGYNRFDEPVFKKIKLLPVLPSISYTWKF